MIGENCQRCSDAAEAEDGGGFAGAWWRFWAKVSLNWIKVVWRREVWLISVKANDLSGVIGAAIVGTFAVILAIYHGGRWVYRR